MQQMDKWHKELDKLSSRRYKRMDGELYNHYKDTLKSLKKELKSYIENYDQLSFSKRLEVENQLKMAQRIDGIISELAGSTQQTVAQYVHDELQQGYMGVWYALEGAENIQLDFGMLPERYIEQLVNKKVDGKTFSKRLYNNRDDLADRVTTTLLSGAVRGDGYAKVAKQVGELTEANYKQALRIARTEGGRVQSTAKQRAYQEAKAKGVNIKKKWLATLDKKTRHQHQELDGQTVEIEEQFEFKGNKADGPRLFGVAGLDINCRCTTITEVNGISPDLRKDNENKEIIKYNSYNEWAEAKGYKQAAPQSKVVEETGTWVERIKKRVKSEPYTLEEVQAIGSIASSEFTNAEIKKATTDYHVIDKEYRAYVGGYEKAKRLPRDEYSKWYNGYKELLDNREKAQMDLYEKRTKFVSEKVKELRDIGKPINNYTKYSSVEQRKNITEVSKLLPEEWVSLSEKEPMYVQNTKRGFYRAHSKGFRNASDTSRKEYEELGLKYTLKKGDYEYYYDTISISGEGIDAKRTAIHELGHRMEHLKPEIKRLEYEFYQRRTKGEEAKWLGKGYRRDEITRVDNFLSKYMGKDYGNKEDSYYELLSMGLESLYTGSYDIDSDEDFKTFILGILLTQ